MRVTVRVRLAQLSRQVVRSVPAGCCALQRDWQAWMSAFEREERLDCTGGAAAFAPAFARGRVLVFALLLRSHCSLQVARLPGERLLSASHARLHAASCWRSCCGVGLAGALAGGAAIQSAAISETSTHPG